MASSSTAGSDRFRIVGGASLKGEVTVTGAKNSVLKLMAASLLAVGKTTIRNVPDIADVDIMSDLLTRLGCTVVNSGSVVTIDVPEKPHIVQITI
jgi:UDP-N-acetylglucosamine 1-carboxyvinyltransferase